MTKVSHNRQSLSRVYNLTGCDKCRVGLYSSYIHEIRPFLDDVLLSGISRSIQGCPSPKGKSTFSPQIIPGRY